MVVEQVGQRSPASLPKAYLVLLHSCSRAASALLLLVGSLHFNTSVLRGRGRGVPLVWFGGQKGRLL